MTVLADGKLLVIGISAAAGAPISTISLARYNANGSLDVTFGSGRVVISGDVGGAGAQQMAIARIWF